MLTHKLRELERDGLVLRTVFPTVPPRVEYALTPLGQMLLKTVTELANWASAIKGSSNAPARTLTVEKPPK